MSPQNEPEEFSLSLAGSTAGPDWVERPTSIRIIFERGPSSIRIIPSENEEREPIPLSVWKLYDMIYFAASLIYVSKKRKTFDVVVPNPTSGREPIPLRLQAITACWGYSFETSFHSYKPRQAPSVQVAVCFEGDLLHEMSCEPPEARRFARELAAVARRIEDEWGLMGD